MERGFPSRIRAITYLSNHVPQNPIMPSMHPGLVVPALHLEILKKIFGDALSMNPLTTTQPQTVIHTANDQSSPCREAESPRTRQEAPTYTDFLLEFQDRYSKIPRTKSPLGYLIPTTPARFNMVRKEARGAPKKNQDANICKTSCVRNNIIRSCPHHSCANVIRHLITTYYTPAYSLGRI